MLLNKVHLQLFRVVDNQWRLHSDEDEDPKGPFVGYEHRREAAALIERHDGITSVEQQLSSEKGALLISSSSRVYFERWVVNWKPSSWMFIQPNLYEAVIGECKNVSEQQQQGGNLGTGHTRSGPSSFNLVCLSTAKTLNSSTEST